MIECFKKIFRRIPGIKWFLDIRRELSLIRFQTTQQTRIQQQLYRETIRVIRLREGIQFPVSYEHQIFSQNGEDGILTEILKRLGLECGRFLEIGSGDGLENNTRLLLETGWEGFWIDGSQRSCSLANKANSKFIKNGNLKIINSFVTANNINQILKNMKIPEDIEVLSLDVDLNTYHVWEKIDIISPTIAIIEYNGFFPAHTKWIADYDENGIWDGGFNMGSALKPLNELSQKKGYRLIGCDLSGTNAFFIKDDLAQLHFSDNNNAEQLFESAKPFLLNNPEHRTDLSN
jgi:hypothetical protein